MNKGTYEFEEKYLLQIKVRIQQLYNTNHEMDRKKWTLTKLLENKESHRLALEIILGDQHESKRRPM